MMRPLSPTSAALQRLILCMLFLAFCSMSAEAQGTYYEVVARNSGKCLDVSGISYDNGAVVQQWDCLGGGNQQWQFVATGDGYFRIIARHSGKSLDVSGISQDNGAVVHQWDWWGGANQQWQLADSGDGYYRITARHSGKVLDVSGVSQDNGAVIHQWDWWGGTNQQWQLRPVSVTSAQVGEWSAPTGWPFVAVHAHLLPNGKVLAWAGENVAAPSHRTDVWLWDPSNGTFAEADNHSLDLFCSGHSLLPDGRLLVTGGHNHYNAHGQPGGEPHTSVFDFRDNSWTQGPDMRAGRWYPTNTTLGSGEVLISSGAVADGQSNDISEVWQTGETLRPLINAPRVQPTYPWMHVGPGGRVFNSGPNQHTDYLSTAANGAWMQAGGNTAISSNYGYRGEGSSVMYEPGKVLIVGGGAPPTNSAEVIDLNQPFPGWRHVGSMSRARRHLNTTLLPDGTVLATGGSSYGGPGDFNNLDPAGAVYAAEIWNPATEQWSGPLAGMQVPRLYHSVALLLPDGRVLSAGGGNIGPGADHPDAEIYSPPYLFRGARPQITDAPQSIGYGQRFFVGTPDTNVTRATLVRLSSVTHAYNQNQRFNDLTGSIERVGGGLFLRAPADGNLCPPGHYMLFLLNDQGVPSVARVVQVSKSSVVSIATGPDNLTRLLWQLPNGAAQIWTLSADGATLLNSVTHGPVRGWSPRAISVGPDNVPHLLWTNLNGAIGLWRLNHDNTLSELRDFGPYAGWKAVGLAGSLNGGARILWEYADGTTHLWRVNWGWGVTHWGHGPFPGWHPVGVAVGYDDRPRILWRHDSGQMAIWNCNPDGSWAANREHGPYGGWGGSAVAVGRDNQAHVLWNNVDGRIGLWSVDWAGDYAGNHDYGPFDGWTAVSMSNGGDSLTRIAWQHANGSLSLWTLGPDNLHRSYTEYAAP